MAGHSKPRFVILLSLILLLVGISARPIQQVTGEGDWYFPETKHVVSGDILDFYSHTQDYILKFGYPISDVEDHPVLPGVKVQYFQRARLEFYPNEAAGNRVRIASLGVWLYDGTDRGKSADLPFASGACRLFTQNNIAVCYEFLKFYDAHQGSTYFGEPISPLEEISNGRLVQYFERARMEWWPENPLGMRVVLTDLGTLYYTRERQNSGAMGPAIIQGEAPQAFQVKAHAFTARPLVSAISRQMVYVIVTDQSAKAVKGAQVMMVVHLPNGQNVNHRLNETQANGLTQAELVVGDVKPNQIIQVDVSVKAPDGAQTATTTYFRVWW
jgi:hypothetical protein